VHLCMRECVYVCGSRDDNRRAPRVVSDARKCARARARAGWTVNTRVRVYLCVCLVMTRCRSLCRLFVHPSNPSSRLSLTLKYLVD